jgi:hypothetical protein
MASRSDGDGVLSFFKAFAAAASSNPCAAPLES